MPRGRRKPNRWPRRIALALLAVPLLYLLAALAGSLIPVNRQWKEPDDGVTVFIANNGVHADIVMPIVAEGLDWQPFVRRRDVARPNPNARWVAFGAGEEKVYLETPRWRDITLRTMWSAIVGGRRVMHVEWVTNPAYVDRAIRLRPEEYRRLWAAIRADFELGPDGKPKHIDHAYGPVDAFYWGSGKASALRTCNSWAADKLRLAGIKTSLWSPFVQGLTWRYRKAESPRSR